MQLKKCITTSAKPKAGYQYNTARTEEDSYVYHASLQHLLTQLLKYILKLITAQ